ncbi:MAG TPA: hypothetical protein PLO37_14930 [Candidatus Hydrogenedentes bacterium]|nr:hypothetical protein [Candidatus Hydrogenedentota bacterium]HPG68141.1 hypothetical protein [Candidatus Hydrogenedentota bacterium]
MKHLMPMSRPLPAKAYYYNLSLAQKLSELTTLVSVVVMIVDLVGGLFTPEE